ncbi:SDR family NAD(P)-dependent oxidoreductase [Zavarzinia sp.]|uniref:SDR family NAD(P)-dependent oxidoreductase n=1 Tax=Zavarzinia sp. TaxID=2027920 RepID=UPI003563F360
MATTEGRLSGRVAIVTGGGKGIGRAIAVDFAREGAAVAVLARSDMDSAEAVAAEVRRHGRRALAATIDVTDPASVETAMDLVAAALGRIDILVNNAGHGRAALLAELPAAEWDATFAVNTKGCFLAGTAAARRMAAAGGGTIVNIAGASAHRAWAGRGAFAPSKAAVINLTRQMALEWAPSGIRVNGVSPGPIFAADDPWRDRRPELVARFGRLPLARPGLPEEVAKAVTFLASDDAAYITGHMLPVDGGSLLTWYVDR